MAVCAAACPWGKRCADNFAGGKRGVEKWLSASEGEELEHQRIADAEVANAGPCHQ